MEPVQFHHGLVSVSDKEVSADGWSRCVDNVSMPPDLLKPFDVSLFEPQEKIPHGNASCVAFVNYVYRTLQMMICESDVFKHQLMWDPKHNSWKLVFAFLPGSRASPPTFFNVTWEMNAPGVWQGFVQGFVNAQA